MYYPRKQRGGRRWWWPSSSSKPASNETGFEAYRERQHLFLHAHGWPRDSSITE
jgi:hypothetical protein